MKSIVLLFLAAVLSFTGLALLDGRARSVALQKSYAANAAAVDEYRRGLGITVSNTSQSMDAPPLGMRASKVRENLGRPLSTARDHYGGEIWSYPDRMVLLDHKGRVVEVTQISLSPASR